MKLEKLMPYQHHKMATPWTSTIQSTDDNNPVNWQTVHTLVTPDLLGTPTSLYEISAGIGWNLDSNKKGAMFRMVVDGVATDFISIEPKDKHDKLMNIFKIWKDNHTSDGPITVEIQALITDRGQGNPTLTVTSLDIVVERKHQ